MSCCYVMEIAIRLLAVRELRFDRWRLMICRSVRGLRFDLMMEATHKMLKASSHKHDLANQKRRVVQDLWLCVHVVV